MWQCRRLCFQHSCCFLLSSVPKPWFRAEATAIIYKRKSREVTDSVHGLEHHKNDHKIVQEKACLYPLVSSSIFFINWARTNWRLTDSLSLRIFKLTFKTLDLVQTVKQSLFCQKYILCWTFSPKSLLEKMSTNSSASRTNLTFTDVLFKTKKTHHKIPASCKSSRALN